MRYYPLVYPRITNWLLNIDMCMLSENIHDYYYVSQGKTTIPGMDDGEEFQLTDVRAHKTILLITHFLEYSLSVFIST